jgi:hypothetical protein
MLTMLGQYYWVFTSEKEPFQEPSQGFLAEFSLRSPRPEGVGNEVEGLTRNDRSLANVILRSRATKNLVHCKKNPCVQRTRCFTSFSMTLRGGHPVHGDATVKGIIPGIARSPFRGSVEMTIGGEEPFPSMSFRTPVRGEKSLRRLAT